MNDQSPASLVALAGREAERFGGATPATPWQPRPRERRGLVALAAVVVLAGGVAAALLQGRAASAPPAAPSAPSPSATVHPAGLWAPSSATSGHAAQEAPADALPVALIVMKTGSEFAIEAIAASRLEAARRLSQAMGASVEGEGALAGTPPLTLRLRTHNANDAWQAVLGPHASHAIHCGARGCRVWLVRSAGHAAASLAPPAAAMTTSLPLAVERAPERSAEPALVIQAEPGGEGSN